MNACNSSRIIYNETISASNANACGGHCACIYVRKCLGPDIHASGRPIVNPLEYFNMNTIKRIRKVKNRYGITNGPVFLGFHFRKLSWYVQKPAPRRHLWSIHHIEDNLGHVEVE
jgi:hypothetical protein